MASLREKYTSESGDGGARRALSEILISSLWSLPARVTNHIHVSRGQSLAQYISINKSLLNQPPHPGKLREQEVSFLSLGMLGGTQPIFVCGGHPMRDLSQSQLLHFLAPWLGLQGPCLHGLSSSSPAS